MASDPPVVVGLMLDRHPHLPRSLLGGDFIRMSISEKYDFSTKITSDTKPPVTTQSKCVVILVANRIGDPRTRISEKYSPR